MKIIFPHLIFLVLSVFAFSQEKKKSPDSTYLDIIYTNEINGISTKASDSIFLLIENKLKKYKAAIEKDDKRYNKVYVTSKTGSQFLEIWSAPDIGFRQFYTIGYTDLSKCNYCGMGIGKLNFERFKVNHGIALGDSLQTVWEKAHLNYFRSFNSKGIKYFYFEKEIKYEVPFTPRELFYYKFRNEILIEIGFGNGFVGVNPMFQY